MNAVNAVIAVNAGRRERKGAAFAMKWLKIIAQGFSPGSTDSAATSRCGAPDLNSPAMRYGYAREPNRSPLQGDRSDKRYPGLKPWAMIYSRSAANSDRLLG